MICLTSFDYFNSNVNVSDETIETNIRYSCLDRFYFPSKPVIYSFVSFVYLKEKSHVF